MGSQGASRPMGLKDPGPGALGLKDPGPGALGLKDPGPRGPGRAAPWGPGGLEPISRYDF